MTILEILENGQKWQIKNKKHPTEFYFGYYWYDENYYKENDLGLVGHYESNLPTNIFEKLKGHKPFYIPHYIDDNNPEFYKEYNSFTEAETALAIALNELGITV